MIQETNVTTNQITEVVHIELKTGEAIFDSARADGNLSLVDYGAVSIALSEILSAFIAENVRKIQVKRGSIYNVNTAAWRMIIDRCGLVRCDEAMGDYVTPLEICPCRACMGAF